MSENYTLVISDVHEKFQRFRKIMKRYGWIKKQVITGDWLDSHREYTTDPTEHLLVLRNWLEDPDHIYVAGNHDMQYLYPYLGAGPLGCTGWRQMTEDAFKLVMKYEHRQKMKNLVHIVDAGNKSYMISHAGVHPSKAHPVLGLTEEYISRECRETIERLDRNTMSHWVACGESRGGPRGEIGGITWLHWGDFEPVEGLNQIVGHTAGNKVRIKEGKDSINYCIDTHLEQVLIIAPDGEIIIEDIFHVG